MHAELHPRSLASAFKRDLGRILSVFHHERELVRCTELENISKGHVRVRRAMVRKISKAYQRYRLLRISSRSGIAVSGTTEAARLDRFMSSMNVNFMHQGGPTASGMAQRAILQVQSTARMR